MFEPLRIGFFALGILIIIGGLINFMATSSLPGGFGAIIQGVISLYWFIVLGFFLLILLRSLFLVVQIIQDANKPSRKAG